MLFYFMFSFKFKAFAMFMTFLLFQSNLNLVLARLKGKKEFTEIFSRQKNLKLPPPLPPLHTPSCVFYMTYGAWIGLHQTNGFSQMPQKNYFPKIFS